MVFDRVNFLKSGVFKGGFFKDGFFLELGNEDAKPAQVDVAATTTAPAEQPPEQPMVVEQGQRQPVPTTAEVIAAELRASQEARPAASVTTFAPEALNPANALPTRRRRAGANLDGFKRMAAGMVRS